MNTMTINDRPVAFTPGETVLAAAKRAGVEIPHLCTLDWAPSPTASCRMCVVELEGSPRLVTSCTLEAREGMVVRTHTPRVLAARRTIVELLVASHPQDCLSCDRSRSCELQRLAADVGARPQRYAGPDAARRDHAIDLSSPSIVRDANKCVLCGRCVTMCHEVQGVGAIDFAGRGFTTRIAPGMNAGLNVSECVFCGQCVRVCPTGALTDKNHVDRVVEALGDPNAYVVAQVAPAVPATLLESVEAGSVRAMLQRLAAALRSVGFRAVFDTAFAADLTTVEEAAELVRRIQRGGALPMFTSCSPAWVRYVETHAPELIPHLSTCKSPQQMAGALIKELYPQRVDLGGRRLVSVAIMPCTAKKYEAEEQGDVDFVLTTREVERLLARFGVDLAARGEAVPLDSPFGTASGAARLFGGTGGVMEAAVRTAHRALTGSDLQGGLKLAPARGLDGVKAFQVPMGALTLHAAVVNGLGRARTILDAVRSGTSDLHFVEVMTCPGGCVGGGGQPYGSDVDALRDRLERLYETDRRAGVRVPSDNGDVRELYETLLGEPLSGVSHRLLHRTYTDRRAEAAEAAGAAGAGEVAA